MATPPNPPPNPNVTPDEALAQMQDYFDQVQQASEAFKSQQEGIMDELADLTDQYNHASTEAEKQAIQEQQEVLKARRELLRNNLDEQMSDYQDYYNAYGNLLDQIDDDTRAQQLGALHMTQNNLNKLSQDFDETMQHMAESSGGFLHRFNQSMEGVQDAVNSLNLAQIADAISDTTQSYIDVTRSIKQQLKWSEKDWSNYNDHMQSIVSDLNYNMSRTEVMNVSAEVIGAGVRDEQQVAKYTKALAKLKVGLDIDVSGLDNLIKASKLLGDNAKMIDTFGDSLRGLEENKNLKNMNPEDVKQTINEMAAGISLIAGNNKDLADSLTKSSTALAGFDSEHQLGGLTTDIAKDIMSATTQEDLNNLQSKYGVLGLDVNNIRDLMQQGKGDEANQAIIQGLTNQNAQAAIMNNSEIAQELGLNDAGKMAAYKKLAGDQNALAEYQDTSKSVNEGGGLLDKAIDANPMKGLWDRFTNWATNTSIGNGVNEMLGEIGIDVKDIQALLVTLNAIEAFKNSFLATKLGTILSRAFVTILPSLLSIGSSLLGFFSGTLIPFLSGTLLPAVAAVGTSLLGFFTGTLVPAIAAVAAPLIGFFSTVILPAIIAIGTAIATAVAPFLPIILIVVGVAAALYAIYKVIEAILDFLPSLPSPGSLLDKINPFSDDDDEKSSQVSEAPSMPTDTMDTSMQAPMMDTSSFSLPSFEEGLSYVPFDGMPAQLHEGESVLTKAQTEQLNNISADGGIPIDTNNPFDTLLMSALGPLGTILPKLISTFTGGENPISDNSDIIKDTMISATGPLGSAAVTISKASDLFSDSVDTNSEAVDKFDNTDALEPFDDKSLFDKINPFTSDTTKGSVLGGLVGGPFGSILGAILGNNTDLLSRLNPFSENNIGTTGGLALGGLVGGPFTSDTTKGSVLGGLVGGPFGAILGGLLGNTLFSSNTAEAATPDNKELIDSVNTQTDQMSQLNQTMTNYSQSSLAFDKTQADAMEESNEIAMESAYSGEGVSTSIGGKGFTGGGSGRTGGVKRAAKSMGAKGSGAGGGGLFSSLKSGLSKVFGGIKSTLGIGSPPSGGGGGGGGGSRTSGPANVPAATGENARDIWNFLTGNGFTPEAAAGVMGNIQQESGFDPLITEDRSQAGWQTLSDVTNGGAGLAQWTDPGRCDRFDEYMASNGLDPHSVQSQMQFMLYEANTYYGDLVPTVSQMTDIDQATAAWEKGYERAGTPMLDQRIKYAHDVYSQFAGASYDQGTPLVPSDQLAVLHKGEAVITADQNPYTNGNPTTTDQVDFSKLSLQDMFAALMKSINDLITSINTYLMSTSKSLTTQAATIDDATKKAIAPTKDATTEVAKAAQDVQDKLQDQAESIKDVATDISKTSEEQSDNLEKASDSMKETTKATEDVVTNTDVKDLVPKYDELGNIITEGFEVPDYNKILDSDDLLVKEAKIKAQKEAWDKYYKANKELTEKATESATPTAEQNLSEPSIPNTNHESISEIPTVGGGFGGFLNNPLGDFKLPSIKSENPLQSVLGSFNKDNKLSNIIKIATGISSIFGSKKESVIPEVTKTNEQVAQEIKPEQSTPTSTEIAKELSPKYDELGNIITEGFEVPDYNKILDSDDLLVRQAKIDAQKKSWDEFYKENADKLQTQQTEASAAIDKMNESVNSTTQSTIATTTEQGETPPTSTVTTNVNDVALNPSIATAEAASAATTSPTEKTLADVVRALEDATSQIVEAITNNKQSDNGLPQPGILPPSPEPLSTVAFRF